MAKRAYDLGSRAESMAATRRRILEAAEGLFVPAWFDDVTIADVARAAGVSSQTVVNHFGSKEQLYRAGVLELVGPRIEEVRGRAVPGELRSVVETVCADYEESGDGTVRLVATAARSAELAGVVAMGRASHRAFVERCFARWLDGMPAAEQQRLVVLLTALLDVATWHQLRRVEGLTPDETCAALLDAVGAQLDRVAAPAP